MEMQEFFVEHKRRGACVCIQAYTELNITLMLLYTIQNGFYGILVLLTFSVVEEEFDFVSFILQPNRNTPLTQPVTYESQHQQLASVVTPLCEVLYGDPLVLVILNCCFNHCIFK